MESAAEAYAREAGCSRLSAALFITHKVPTAYTRAVMDGIAATNAPLTVKETIAAYEQGLDVDYMFSCIRLGIGVSEIRKLWKDGVALDYVQTIYGTV